MDIFMPLTVFVLVIFQGKTQLTKAIMRYSGSREKRKKKKKTLTHSGSCGFLKAALWRRCWKFMKFISSVSPHILSLLLPLTRELWLKEKSALGDWNRDDGWKPRVGCDESRAHVQSFIFPKGKRGHVSVREDRQSSDIKPVYSDVKQQSLYLWRIIVKPWWYFGTITMPLGVDVSSLSENIQRI